MTRTNDKPEKFVQTPSDREVEAMLVPGEKIVLRARIHNAIYWKAVAVLIFAAVVGLYIQPFGLLFGVSGLIMLGVAVLTRHFILLVLTDKRVLARYGLLQMDIVDIRYSKVESIDIERMLPGHVFGYANVVVMGTGQRFLRIPYVSNAAQFRRFYNELTLQQEVAAAESESAKAADITQEAASKQ